jgi:hypothetical protein
LKKKKEGGGKKSDYKFGGEKNVILDHTSLILWFEIDVTRMDLLYIKSQSNQTGSRRKSWGRISIPYNA